MQDKGMAQTSKQTGQGIGTFTNIDDESTLSKEQILSHQQRIATRLEEVDANSRELQKAVRNALADVEYARQRAEADLAHARKFAIEGFAKALLTFKDSLETALTVETTDVAALRAGLELSLKQLHTAFEKNRLVEICPQPGERFDSQKHRSLVTLEAGHVKSVVAGVEQKGYTINGRLIRPAAVTVLREK
jgi:molecular chaperone GrpE